jgi:predicted esterase
MKPEIRTYRTDLPFGFHLRPGPENALALFLHGYTDSGASFLRRAVRDAAPPYALLAPNGPFPVPVKRGDEYKEAYAWYFWDYAVDAVIMPPSIAVDLLGQLLGDLGHRDTPKVLIGFSQGGFLMPHLLPHLKNVRGLIAVGSSFRPEDYPPALDIPVHAIHGAADTIIDPVRARQQFNLLKNSHPHDGAFHLIPGLGHTVNEEASALLLATIASCFQKACE